MINTRNIELANLRSCLRNGGASQCWYLSSEERAEAQKDLENRIELLEAENFLNLTDEEVEQIRKLTGAKNDFELKCELEKIILEQRS